MARSHTARNRQVTTLERFDVFISYSRRDVEFVRQLDQRLQGQKRTTWVDWGSVRPGSEFPPRIRAGVEGASNFVFIVSPESVISEWCRLELAHAVKHGKRLVSILLHPVDPKQMPKAIRTLHWIDFHSGSLDSAVATLIEVIDTDQDWIDEHTRVLQRGLEWEAHPDDGFLLRGQELTAAVKWLGGASETSTRRLSTLHRTSLKRAKPPSKESFVAGGNCPKSIWLGGFPRNRNWPEKNRRACLRGASCWRLNRSACSLPSRRTMHSIGRCHCSLTWSSGTRIRARFPQ